MGDREQDRACDPMGGGCKALSDIAASIKSDIYTHMKEDQAEVDKKIDAVNAKLWAIVVGVLLLLGKSLLGLLS